MGRRQFRGFRFVKRIAAGYGLASVPSSEQVACPSPSLYLSLSAGSVLPRLGRHHHGVRRHGLQAWLAARRADDAHAVRSHCHRDEYVRIMKKNTFCYCLRKLGGNF